MDDHATRDSGQRRLSFRLLPAGTATTLRARTARQVVHLWEGRLWLTTSGSHDRLASDVWLEPGDRYELQAGRPVVVEADIAARFEVLVATTRCRPSSMLSLAIGWLARRAGVPVPTHC